MLKGYGYFRPRPNRCRIADLVALENVIPVAPVLELIVADIPDSVSRLYRIQPVFRKRSGGKAP